MPNRDALNTDELLPGDRVRVIDGTFAGLEGTVLAKGEAKKLRERNGGEEGPLTRWPPGAAYVALPLFGREVPIFLERFQIERIGQ
jgi:transcription antitermination factor NusG